jgi:hypothetical protein
MQSPTDIWGRHCCRPLSSEQALLNVRFVHIVMNSARIPHAPAARSLGRSLAKEWLRHRDYYASQRSRKEVGVPLVTIVSMP